MNVREFNTYESIQDMIEHLTDYSHKWLNQVALKNREIDYTLVRKKEELLIELHPEGDYSKKDDYTTLRLCYFPKASIFSGKIEILTRESNKTIESKFYSIRLNDSGQLCFVDADNPDGDEIDKLDFGGKFIARLISHGSRMRGVISDE